jgi:hypothetical protein
MLSVNPFVGMNFSRDYPKEPELIVGLTSGSDVLKVGVITGFERN